MPLGLDLYLPVPEENSLTAERIAKGRPLFFDRRLSRDAPRLRVLPRSRARSSMAAPSPPASAAQRRRNPPALINRIAASLVPGWARYQGTRMRISDSLLTKS